MAKLWKRMLLPLLLVLLMMPLSSCGKSVADRDILTTAKTTNTIVWGCLLYTSPSPRDTR